MGTTILACVEFIQKKVQSLAPRPPFAPFRSRLILKSPVMRLSIMDYLIAMYDTLTRRYAHGNWQTQGCLSAIFSGGSAALFEEHPSGDAGQHPDLMNSVLCSEGTV